jgi:hypothetical protein
LYRFGDVEVDPVGRRITKAGRHVITVQGVGYRIDGLIEPQDRPHFLRKPIIRRRG